MPSPWEHVKFAREPDRGEEGELMSRLAFGNLRVQQAHSVYSIRDNRVSSRKSRSDEVRATESFNTAPEGDS